MRGSTAALGFHFDFVLERPRDAAPSVLARARDRLRAAVRRAQAPRLAELSDASLAELGLKPEEVPGHPARDPLLGAARRCMEIPFWPGLAPDKPDDRAR